MRLQNSRFKMSGHLPGLDGVRGLAILMVMAIHFVGDSTPYTFGQRLVVKVAGYGLLGVDLFFVLSGFLITGLLLDAKSRPHYFRNFYARRTLRIFPLYYLVLAASFVVLPQLTNLTPTFEVARTHQAWLWSYTANFYIAAKSSWVALTYMSHFWSLAVEEHFYLMWPLVVFSFRREMLERICIGVLAGGLALRIAAALFGASEVAISVLTPCRIDTLCVGGLLAVLARREGGAEMLMRRAGKAALTLAAAALIISAWCATTKLGLLPLHQVRNTVFALFFGALSLISLLPPSNPLARIFQGAVLKFFGKYSYGLYVYHGILTWYLQEIGFERRLDALLGNHWLVIAVKAVGAVSVSVAVAVLSYQLFEKRFLALKRFFEAPEGGADDAARESRPAPAAISTVPGIAGESDG